MLAGTYALAITATGPNGCTPPAPGTSNGCVSQTVNAQLVVQSGQGFSITGTPLTSTTVAPGGAAQYNINVNSVGGYRGSVNLSASGSPPGASVTLSAYSVQAGGVAVTLTVATTANTPLATYSSVVTGTNGPVSQYAAAPLTVTFPSAASMLTPPPGGNIAGGSTLFTWNAGLGATQYTVTATAAGGQTSSATTGPGQLSATLSLPATSQTAAVTLQTMTAGGALTQYYSYTIQPPGAAQSLTLAPGNTMPTVPANGQEVQYLFSYTATGGARPSPQDITGCLSTDVAIRIRIVGLTAGTATIGGTATLGFTAPIGTPAGADDWTWECDDGGGSGSGGGGTGSTGDPTPVITSVSPSPIPAGQQTLTVGGAYFGFSPGAVYVSGACTLAGNTANWSTAGNSFQIPVMVDPTASGFCTFVVTADVDDDDDPFDPEGGSSPTSAPFVVPVIGPAPSAPPALTIVDVDTAAAITNTTQSVMVGHYLNIAAVVLNSTATYTYKWAPPPGDTATGWSDTASQSQGPTPLPASSLQNQNLKFAWTDTSANAQCANAGQCLSVVATPANGGQPLSAAVQYAVTLPQMAPSATQAGTVILPQPSTPIYCPNFSQLAMCNDGGATQESGITFDFAGSGAWRAHRRMAATHERENRRLYAIGRAMRKEYFRSRRRRPALVSRRFPWRRLEQRLSDGEHIVYLLDMVDVQTHVG